MRRSAALVMVVGLLSGWSFFLLPAARAQDGGCQLQESPAGPARQVLRCPGGATIEAEDAAVVHVQDAAGRGRPAGATVDSGGALFDLPANYPGGFQILAPRAIASVRGTTWIVDVQPAQTSVFVMRGEVQVRRATGGPAVRLRRGQGVDVGDDPDPLQVKRWPPARVSALLRRFGRP